MDRAIGVANVFVGLVALSWFFYFLDTRVAAVAVTLEVLVLHGLASIPERGTGKGATDGLVVEESSRCTYDRPKF